LDRRRLGRGDARVLICAHTLTAVTDVGAVHDALGPAGGGQVAAVLVADGIVGWRAACPPDRERIAELRPGCNGLMLQ